MPNLLRKTRIVDDPAQPVPRNHVRQHPATPQLHELTEGGPMPSRTQSPEELYVQVSLHTALTRSIKRRTDAGLATDRETFANITSSFRLIAETGDAEP